MREPKTRREFIQGISCVGAALGLAGGTGCKTVSVTPPTAPPKPQTASEKSVQPLVHRWSLGCYVSPLDEKLAERLAWLKEHDIRVVGLDGMSKKDAATVKRAATILERSGATVDALHGETGLARPDNDVEKLRAAHIEILDRAKALGAKYVVLHFRLLVVSGANYWQVENEYIKKVGVESYDRRIADFLTWLCEQAAKRGRSIAIETVPMQHEFGYQMAEAVAMIERVGAPNLGICLDTGHINAANMSVAEAFRIVGRHLLTTHVHDNLGTAPPRIPAQKADLHLVPGLGTINWPFAIQAMEEIGFRGPAVFEGVNLGQKKDAAAWEKAVEMSIANWRIFETMNASL